MDPLYRIQIINHYKYPRYFRLLPKPTVQQSVANRYCGDELHISLVVEDGRITDVGFTGTGCALSIASASMLMEQLKGKSLADALAWSDDDQLKLVGVPKTTGRRKCILLGHQGVHKALASLKKQQPR